MVADTVPVAEQVPQAGLVAAGEYRSAPGTLEVEVEKNCTSLTFDGVASFAFWGDGRFWGTHEDIAKQAHRDLLGDDA